jgi:hypothetical protein
MGLSPLVIISFRSIFKLDTLLLIYIFFLLFSSLVIYPETTRWSTVLYSCVFFINFMAFIRVYKYSNITLLDFQKFLKYLILTYAFVLVFQQVSTLVGLPVFNLGNNLGTIDSVSKWKLNSLALEPSWTGRIFGLFMFCFICVRERVTGRRYDFYAFKEDKLVWICFFWSMFTMVSATAILFVFFVISKFVHLRNLIFSIMFFILLFLGYKLSNVENDTIKRIEDVMISTLKFDEKAVIEADHSASFRIVPFIVLLKGTEPDMLELFFGHGTDYVLYNVDFELSNSDVTGGGTLALLTEYGLICFVLYLLLTIKLCCDLKEPTSIIFWFFLVVLYGTNVQIPWLAMMLLYINKTLPQKKLN